jgi:hypothetical protein
MEVSGPDYQLIRVRRTQFGLFQLVFDDTTRCYFHIHRKHGVKIGFEYAGTEESAAIRGFDDYVEERAITT